jgi:hypothetical protein
VTTGLKAADVRKGAARSSVRVVTELNGVSVGSAGSIHIGLKYGSRPRASQASRQPDSSEPGEPRRGASTSTRTRRAARHLIVAAFSASN